MILIIASKSFVKVFNLYQTSLTSLACCAETARKWQLKENIALILIEKMDELPSFLLKCKCQCIDVALFAIIP